MGQAEGIEMIKMGQAIVPGSRTPTRGSAWRAECEINGTMYEATSRSGAPQALARVLVGGGVLDQPVLTITTGALGMVWELRYPSLHEMATRTFAESATHPLSEVPFTERPDFLRGEGENRGEDDAEA
jgi:hypothetical protein